MSDNSQLRPIHQSEPISSTYCDPVLIKDGTVSCLYRVSRAGKYFIIKTAKGDVLEMLLVYSNGNYEAYLSNRSS